MSLFEEWADEEDELNFSRRSRPPASYTVVDHGRWFRRLFPEQRYTVFFRQLNRITKQKLSFSERDEIIRACFSLLLDKEYVETAEDFRSQHLDEARQKTMVISTFKKINSLANQLLEHVGKLNKLTFFMSRRDMQEFRFKLHEPLDEGPSRAPLVEVLQRISDTSKNMLEEELKSKAKQGPSPDTGLRNCISRLAQVFGENAPAGWSRKEERRASPFIDFVQVILYALPDNAMIGRNGPYLPASIEAHVAAALADVKKSLNPYQAYSWPRHYEFVRSYR